MSGRGVWGAEEGLEAPRFCVAATEDVGVWGWQDELPGGRLGG